MIEESQTFPTGDPPPYHSLAPIVPGVGFPAAPLGPLLPGHEWPPAYVEQGPLALTLGPRRPSPGEKGFFFDEEGGTIIAGIVERIDIEYDIDEAIVSCVVTNGGIRTETYAHAQCFYYNEDAVAFGIKYIQEKNSG